MAEQHAAREAGAVREAGDEEGVRCHRDVLAIGAVHEAGRLVHEGARVRAQPREGQLAPQEGRLDRPARAAALALRVELAHPGVGRDQVAEPHAHDTAAHARVEGLAHARVHFERPQRERVACSP